MRIEKAARREKRRSAAVRAIGYESPTAAERKAIAEGRTAYEQGDFIRLDDWRRALGLRA